MLTTNQQIDWTTNQKYHSIKSPLIVVMILPQDPAKSQEFCRIKQVLAEQS